MLSQSPEPEAHDRVLGNSISNWNMELLVFEEGKAEYPEKSSEQEREPTTNSTRLSRQVRESNPGTLVGAKRSHHCATPVPLSTGKLSRERHVGKSSKCESHKTVTVLVLTISLRKAPCMTKLVSDRKYNAKKYNFRI